MSSDRSFVTEELLYGGKHSSEESSYFLFSVLLDNNNKMRKNLSLSAGFYKEVK